MRRGGSPALWTAPPPAGYTLPTTDTTELTLTDLRFTRDGVGNPLTINDLSSDTWPGGARPVSRAMTYDSAYRIQRVDYTHGGDSFTPYYQAEALAGDRRPIAEGLANGRTAFQTFATDAQGNVTSANDDAALRFDRSLGPVRNGIGIDGSVHGPNQLIDADGMHASYDPAGNLVELTVARDTCWSQMPSCSHRFVYDWDETGQLARARRWDFLPGPVPAFNPAAVPAWDLSYAYGAGGRTRITKKEALGTEFHTLDVFGTLRIVHVEYDAPTNDYRVSLENEVGFVGGVARVFYDVGKDQPMAGPTPLHVFLDIGDHLGSSAFIIDKDSGEVVERTTHQPYGALETDFRPDRWGAAREAFKFTGKEEDIEVGATYFGARYYNARLGRFMSADPLAVHAGRGDLNPYAYVGGHVMSSVDPLGLCESEPGGICDDVEVVATRDPSASQTKDMTSAAAEGAAAQAAGRPVVAAVPSSALDMVTGNGHVPIGGGNYVRLNGLAATGRNAVKNTVISAADPIGYRFLLSAAGYSLEEAVASPASDGPKDRSRVVMSVIIVFGSVAVGKFVAPAAPAAAAEGGGGGGATLFHGTDIASARGFLAGAELETGAAAARSAGAPSGFYLATDSATAQHFALTRSPGGVLQYQLSPSAVTQLRGAGARIGPIAPGPNGFPVFPGQEFVVPPDAFGLFNGLRSSGQIIVLPF